MSAVSLTDEQVRRVLALRGIRVGKDAHPVAILSIRDADGDGNEFGVYDDRFYVVTASGVTAFAGNTDPSAYVNGRAQMETGQVVWYRAGIHKISLPPGNPRRYPAFRQARNAYFNRKGEGREFSNIAANLHRGGVSGTSSLACQTVPVGRWEEFRKLVYGALGVTTDQVRQSPSGTGPQFPYLILSRQQLADALEKGSATTPEEAPASKPWAYLVDGKGLTGTRIVGGEGYAPTRATLAVMVGSASPATLEFEWAPDGPDADTSPDLFFTWKGQNHPIRVLDAETPQTEGSIRDMAKAAGLVPIVDAEARTVTFERTPHA